MRRFWCSGDSTSKRVLDVLESFYLRLWKISSHAMKAADNRSTCSSVASLGLVSPGQQLTGITLFLEKKSDLFKVIASE